MKHVRICLLLLFVGCCCTPVQVGGQEMRQAPQQLRKAPQVVDPRFGSGRTETEVTTPERRWEPGENDRRIFIIIDDNGNKGEENRH